MNETTWKPRDCYKFIMKEAHTYLNKTETNTHRYSAFGSVYAQARRKRAFDDLIQLILQEGGEDLSLDMKKKLLNYVLRTEMRIFVTMCLTMILVVSGAAWLMFINYQRLGVKEIGWTIAAITIGSLLYLVYYFVMRRGIRDAIIRACMNADNNSTPD